VASAWHTTSLRAITPTSRRKQDTPSIRINAIGLESLPPWSISKFVPLRERIDISMRNRTLEKIKEWTHSRLQNTM
jgi:hypothetical protein